MLSNRLALLALVLSAACRLEDTTTPVPQPDEIIFGRITATRAVAGETGVSDVELRAGLPEALKAVMTRDRRPVPTLEKELQVKVRIGPDSLCVVEMLPADIGRLRVGQEVAVVPRPGTSAMVGTKVLLAEAAEIYRFGDYQVRHLPRSLEELPAALGEPRDARRINSAGTERTPLPLAGGRVVYFAAGLLPPLVGGKELRGAARAGMTDAGGAPVPWVSRGATRPYRVAWGEGGWAVPEVVELPGLAPEAGARITWVSQEETACLVEVESGDGSRSLLASARASAGSPWGPLEPVKVEGGASAGDAQRFGSQRGALVWTVYDGSASDLWLALHGQAPAPVDPRINTLGPEWAPRVGPNNALFFCRGERQLVFVGGAVEEVRLPGAQRHPLLEAAPVAGGSLLFFRVPRFVPGEPDWDLAVASRGPDGKLDAAVRLDDWRPAA